VANVVFEFIPEIPLRAFASFAVKVLVLGFVAKTIWRAFASFAVYGFFRALGAPEQ